MLALNCLYARLLVETHHHAAWWRLQIKRTDLGDLFAKERIGTVQPKLEPLRLHVAIAQDAMDTAAAGGSDPAQRQVLEQQVQRPAAEALPVRQRVARRRYDLGPAHGIYAARPARPRRIGQRSPNVLSDATSRKTPPPARHRIGIDAQLPRDLARGPLLVCKQRNPAAPLLCESAAMGVQQCLERFALGQA